MAPSSHHSEPCVTQRPPVVAEQLPIQQPGPCGDTAPEAAGTSSDQQAARAADNTRRDDLTEEEKKKDRAAAEDAATAGSYGGGMELQPARRAGGEESARERLKRHRTEMAGRVRIPDMWGQERLLKDWVDCAVFDRPLAATAGLLNAREALVAECAAARRATGRPLRVQNGCS